MEIMTARTASLALAALALASSLALAPPLAPRALAQTAPKDAPKAAPQPGGIPVPQPEVLLVLIRSAIIGLDHANRTGNYSVLRELGGPTLQQLSTAQLSTAFTNLRNGKVDLLPTAIATPQLVQPPAVTPQGLLQLVGFFPTQPRRIEFNIVYQAVGGQWRLAGINVGLGQSPQADAGSDPNAATAAKPKAPGPAAKK
jgi:hypothetical protein